MQRKHEASISLRKTLDTPDDIMCTVQRARGNEITFCIFTWIKVVKISSSACDMLVSKNFSIRKIEQSSALLIGLPLIIWGYKIWNFVKLHVFLCSSAIKQACLTEPNHYSLNCQRHMQVNFTCNQICLQSNFIVNKHMHRPSVWNLDHSQYPREHHTKCNWYSFITQASVHSTVEATLNLCMDITYNSLYTNIFVCPSNQRSLIHKDGQ